MKILAYLAIAVIINVFSLIIDSDFIHVFPGADFLAMLVTIMAINTATSSYIISKLEELADKSNPRFDFSATYRQIKLSLLEQVILVSLSCLVLIIRSSKIISEAIKGSSNEKYYNAGIDVIFTLIFIMVIGILWDTGKSIFSLVLPNKKK